MLDNLAPNSRKFLNLLFPSHLWMHVRVAESLPIFLGEIGVQKDLMVSRNQEFVFEVEFCQKLNKSIEMALLVVPGEITAMNEYAS